MLCSGSLAERSFPHLLGWSELQYIVGGDLYLYLLYVTPIMSRGQGRRSMPLALLLFYSRSLCVMIERGPPEECVRRSGLGMARLMMTMRTLFLLMMMMMMTMMIISTGFHE